MRKLIILFLTSILLSSIVSAQLELIFSPEDVLDMIDDSRMNKINAFMPCSSHSKYTNAINNIEKI